MGFDNASIIPPRCRKPHICVRDGWWRVSKYPKIPSILVLFDAAHIQISYWNAANYEKYFKVILVGDTSMCQAYEGEKAYLIGREIAEANRRNEMGDGIKAMNEDAAELERALKKVELTGDKKWGSHQMPFWQEEAIKQCAKQNKSKAQTIKALIEEKHHVLATQEYRDEMEERAKLVALAQKY